MTEQRVIGLYILYDYVCSMEQKGGGGWGVTWPNIRKMRVGGQMFWVYRLVIQSPNQMFYVMNTVQCISVL